MLSKKILKITHIISLIWIGCLSSLSVHFSLILSVTTFLFHFTFISLLFIGFDELLIVSQYFLDIISLILILVQAGVLKTFRDKRKGLITQTTTYIHMDSYIDEENVINTLTAINTLLLMLSFTKYLASWSFTLKIYSQIMTTVRKMIIPSKYNYNHILPPF